MTRLAMDLDDLAVKRIMRLARNAVGPDRALRAIGARHLRWINENFVEEGAERRWKPLARSTVAGRRRGSSKILQDTGRLRMSFNAFGFRTSGRHVDVGTESRIAKIHHFGTGPYTIRPRRARVLRFVTADGVRYARRVRHPGLPARPLLPSRALALSMAADAVEGLLRKELRE